MGTISDFLSLAGAKSKPDAIDTQAPIQPSDDPSAYGDKPESLTDVGTRIGGENEALRNLLIDTTLHLTAVDDLKESFSRLVDPLNSILTTLEQERGENARVRGALAATSSSHQTLRSDFQRLGKRSSELEMDNQRRRQELESALSHAREVEADRAKLSREMADIRAALPEIEKQLSEETSQVRALTEERTNLADRVETSDKRVVALEIEVARVLESYSLLGSARDNLQLALDRALTESSRMGRQLAETETALSDARGKLEQTVGTLAMAEAERNKLAAACDQANERRQTEVYALSLKLDALRSHSDAAEKLLATAHQSLVARSEEIRMAEVKLLGADVARTKAEKNAENQVAIVEGWQQQVKKLEHSNAELAERCRVIVETLTTSENWLVQSKEKINSLTDQVRHFQADAAASRAKFEEDFFQVNATLEHERCERALAEGALVTVRGDYARLQGLMAQERSLRRGSTPRRSVSKDTR